MKLSAWLSEQKVSQQSFAAAIGSSQPQVARFAAGTRIPSRETMAEIVRVTNGSVTANDFFDCGVDTPSEAA